MVIERGSFKEKPENGFDYFIWVEGEFRVINAIYLLRNIEQLEEKYGHLWSARATGLFGEYDCVSGNGRRGGEKSAKRRKVPKNKEEVILAFGEQGLEKLIELGYIPCPTCKPESNPDFWRQAQTAIKRVYGFDSTTDFADKNILGYDARRVKWEEILPIVGGTPDRLYVPQGLDPEELTILRERFRSMGFDLPPTGYYDRNTPGGFFEYRF